MQGAVTVDQLYPHIRVVLGIILGLGITTVLKGIASIVEHPRRRAWSIIHLLWVAWVLFSIVTFWWWEFRLSTVPSWTFGSYLFVISYCSLYFLLSSLLFPDDMQEYAGYEAYFIHRRAWFFGLIALITLFDQADTALKGHERWHALGLAYPIHTVLMLVIAASGAMVANRRVQLAIAGFALVYQLGYFAHEYLLP